MILKLQTTKNYKVIVTSNNYK